MRGPCAKQEPRASLVHAKGFFLRLAPFLPFWYSRDQETMSTIIRSSEKVKSKQARTKLHSCNTHHKEPLPIERFLHGVRRSSTRKIGLALFSILSSGPQVVNIAELARDTGYSRVTAYHAIEFFLGPGKLQRINERRTGKRRPCMYKLDDSFTEKQESP